MLTRGQVRCHRANMLHYAP